MPDAFYELRSLRHKIYYERNHLGKWGDELKEIQDLTELKTLQDRVWPVLISRAELLVNYLVQSLEVGIYSGPHWVDIQNPFEVVKKNTSVGYGISIQWSEIDCISDDWVKVYAWVNRPMHGSANLKLEKFLAHFPQIPSVNFGHENGISFIGRFQDTHFHFNILFNPIDLKFDKQNIIFLA